MRPTLALSSAAAFLLVPVLVGAAEGTPVESGKEIYERPGLCISCHQAAGEGIPGVFPPLIKTPSVIGEETVPIRIVLGGMMGQITVAGQVYNSAMPGQGAQLSDDEIAAVLTYVRSSFGNAAPAVTAAAVAKERAKYDARGERLYTPAELGIK